MGKNRRIVDVLWHDGTHLADAIMFLTNSALRHRKSFGSPLDSRTGTAWLEGELRNKENQCIPVVIEIGARRDHLVFEMEFSCEKGRLRIGNGVFEIWKTIPSPYAEKFRSLELTDQTFSGPTGYFANMIKDAVCCVRQNKRHPRSSALDGLRVIEYLDSVSALQVP